MTEKCNINSYCAFTPIFKPLSLRQAEKILMRIGSAAGLLHSSLWALYKIEKVRH